MALILPDYCTRLAVLDFDSFPSDAAQQLSLIRFRLKRSVPFDVESAAISYWAQPAADKKMDVVAAVAPLEIVSRYEAPFRAAGMLPGLVTLVAGGHGAGPGGRTQRCWPRSPGECFR